MVRIEPTAEDSFAAIRDLRRFGIAMAAMIRMMATTISNSIREKPFCFFMMLDLLDNFYVARARYTYRKPETNAAAEVIARSVSCSTLIINRLLKLRRMRPRTCLPTNGQKSLTLPLFVHHQKHKSSLLIMTRRLRRCGFLAASTLQVVLLGIVTEGAVTDLQQLRSSGPNPSRLFQSGLQIPPFSLGNFLLEIHPVDWKTRRLAPWHPHGRCSRIAGDPIRQHSQGNLPAGFQGDGAFHRVFELANVAGPIVGFQAGHPFRGNTLNRFSHCGTEALEEVASEQWNIIAAFAQGWHLYGNHAKTIVKVLAETAFRDLLFKLLVRGGNDADIHIRFFGTADRADFAFLEDAVELHLHGEAHISDLIHEERAAMGSLEQAPAV